VPRRTRSRGAALISAAVVASGLAGGCTVGKRTLKADTVERAIAATLTAEGEKVASVSCPKGQEARRGGRFDCTVVFADRHTGLAHVVQDDANGRFHLGP
jgi:hypothetical protein